MIAYNEENDKNLYVISLFRTSNKIETIQRKLGRPENDKIANKVCENVGSGCTQTEYNGDAEKSTVKQSLLSSYNRVLAPKVKVSVTAALSVAGAGAAAPGDALTIGNHLPDSLNIT